MWTSGGKPPFLTCSIPSRIVLPNLLSHGAIQYEVCDPMERLGGLRAEVTLKA